MGHLGNFTKKVSENVRPLDDLMGAAEAMLLSGVSRVASWGASIPNAVMVARSAREIFGLPWGLSLAIAASLELIGHALVSHWQDAREWNASKRKSDLPANASLALGLVVGYFALDLAMVGVLAWSVYLTTGDWRIGIALCYPLVGVAVAVVTNERAHLFRLRQGVKAEKQERRQERQAKRNRETEAERVAALVPMAPAQVPTAPEPTTKQRAIAILGDNGDMTGTELGRQLGVSERMGRKLKTALVPALVPDGYRGNGQHPQDSA